MTGSSPSPYADDLLLALAIADVADAISVGLYRSFDLSIESKADFSPVTAADRAVENAVLAALARERPDDAVLSEESGERPGLSGRRWILDPIDGTKNFMRGVPMWATLLALESASDVVVGVASAPALRRRWWASRGAGAWTSETGDAGQVVRQTRVSSVGSLLDAYISGSFDSLAEARTDGVVTAMLTSPWRARAFGEFWQHVLVAEGALDLAFDLDVQIWDVAPLKIITEESGGRFTDLQGAPSHGRSALSTNGLLHASALAILRDHSA
jgi:histidinol-phosphatase